MTRTITKTLLTLGFVGAFAAGASAQMLTTYTPGDFLVGFRQVGSNNSVVADIGPITSFTTRQTFTINLGSTLTAQYGNGFANDQNVFFSLSETNAGDRTSFVTSAEYLTGPSAGPATIWSRQTNSNSISLQNKINNFGGEFTSAGRIQPKTDPNAYQNFMPGGTTDAGHATTANISYGFFNPTIEGNLGQGTAGIALDLIQLVPGSGPGTNLGIFQLSSDGNSLTFTPAGVPEPSAYAAMAVWGALTLLAFVMKKARKSSTGDRPA